MATIYIPTPVLVAVMDWCDDRYSPSSLKYLHRLASFVGKRSSGEDEAAATCSAILRQQYPDTVVTFDGALRCMARFYYRLSIAD